MPASYFSLLSFSDGGEGPLAVQPFYLCLDPTAELLSAKASLPVNQGSRRSSYSAAMAAASIWRWTCVKSSHGQ
jgi:hypothetical protein